MELNLNDLGTPFVQSWTYSGSGALASIDKPLKLNLNGGTPDDSIEQFRDSKLAWQ